MRHREEIQRKITEYEKLKTAIRGTLSSDFVEDVDALENSICHLDEKIMILNWVLGEHYDPTTKDV